jgi:hypothetical protein
MRRHEQVVACYEALGRDGNAVIEKFKPCPDYIISILEDLTDEDTVDKLRRHLVDKLEKRLDRLRRQMTK